MRRGVKSCAMGLAALVGLHAVAPKARADLLGDIIGAFQNIDGVLKDINFYLASTQQLLNQVWPSQAFGEIALAFQQARTIRQDIDTLACGWRFSPRVQKLWDGLTKGIRWCKPEFQLLYGSTPAFFAEDLDEYHARSSVLRHQMIASRIARSQSDQDNANWLLQQSLLGGGWPFGPGYSQRLSAVAAADLARTLHSNGDIEMEELHLEQDESDYEMFLARKEVDFSILLAGAMAGQVPELTPGTP